MRRRARTSGVRYVARCESDDALRSRLRFADEALRVTLNGQQLFATANATFRYYAQPRPTAPSP